MRRYLFSKMQIDRMLMCILGIFLLMSVAAQENDQHTLQVRLTKRIDELIRMGQYETAVHYLDNANKSELALNGRHLGQSLHFLRVMAGVYLNETYYINTAIEYVAANIDEEQSSRLSFALGHHFFVLSMYSEALMYLENAKQLYLNKEENQQLQFEKGVAYFSQKKFDNAKPYFKGLLQHDSSSFKTDIKYYLGFIAFSENQFSDALTYFQSIANDRVYSKAVPFYLAYIFHNQGNESKALEYGENYLRNADGLHTIEMLQLMASIYFNQDEYSNTVSLYEKLISLGVSLNPTQRFELGTGYYHASRYTKAVDQLKPLSIGNDDIAAESMFVLGLSYLKLSENSNARTSFQYCTSSNLSSDKKEIAAYFDSKLSFELGFEDQGFKSLTSFLETYPSSKYTPELKEILLQYYTKTNNFRAAIEMLDNMDLSNPSVKSIVPRIYFGRALELIYDVQYENAERMLRQLNGYSSSDYYFLSLFWMGEIAFRKSDFGSAIKYLNQFLSNPGHASGDANEVNANYNLGYCYYEMEDYKKAYPFFEKVYLIDKDPADVKVRESILRAADCAFMDRNFPKAKLLYERITGSNGFGNDYATFQLSLIEGIKSPAVKAALLKKAVQEFEHSSYINLMYMELADTYMSEEEYENAVPVLNKLIAVLDNDDELKPLSILKLGIAHYNLDNTDDAIKQYKVLIKDFPNAAQTTEAIENAKLIFVENGRINDYQNFLEAAGKSISEMEKDSLMYRYIQNAYALDQSSTILPTLNSYLNQFSSGLYVSNVLYLKADVLYKMKSFKEAAETFEAVASKGVSAYQEKSLVSASKLYFNELKDYEAALRCYEKIISISKDPTVVLGAQRNGLKAYYQSMKFDASVEFCKKVLKEPSIGKEDSALCYVLLGYAEQDKKEFKNSVELFRTASLLSSSMISAEARYQMANSLFKDSSYANAEQAAIQTIENAGSYEKWITKAYILLADLFILQNDFFNAKATLKSVIEHSTMAELKKEAQEKLNEAELSERTRNKKK